MNGMTVERSSGWICIGIARFANDPVVLCEQVAKAGPAPEVARKFDQRRDAPGVGRERAEAVLDRAAGHPPPRCRPPVRLRRAVVVHQPPVLVDPRSDGEDAMRHDQTIVIEGTRIAEVGNTESVRVPTGATLVNARGKYVIPGLIDAHVHFFQSGNLYTRPDAADFNAYMPYAKEVERNKARLPATFKVWLASGVTSVVDVGGPFWNFDVRDAAARRRTRRRSRAWPGEP